MDDLLHKTPVVIVVLDGDEGQGIYGSRNDDEEQDTEKAGQDKILAKISPAKSFSGIRADLILFHCRIQASVIFNVLPDP